MRNFNQLTILKIIVNKFIIEGGAGENVRIKVVMEGTCVDPLPCCQNDQNCGGNGQKRKSDGVQFHCVGISL